MMNCCRLWDGGPHGWSFVWFRAKNLVVRECTWTIRDAQFLRVKVTVVVAVVVSSFLEPNSVCGKRLNLKRNKCVRESVCVYNHYIYMHARIQDAPHSL